ncbi:MAG TPA: DUF72 domain-containing protein [Phycisphaerales bacterium]|nr:DUF72 domain-containing protein [Phycisphaerales bacterium]HMP36699.1 DUF72 domain-containing protein [Phycisphaerales bacterium]
MSHERQLPLFPDDQTARGVTDAPVSRRRPAAPSTASDRGGSPPAPVPLDSELRDLAAGLPPALRMGTSSWSFPGWAGLVYRAPEGRARLSEAALARAGLAAYAQHPLFRSVGIDRTFYAPVPAAVHAAYAAAVPADFRFLVKAPQSIVSARRRDGAPESAFLDPDLAAALFVRPAAEGLGERLGVLLVQCPPLPRSEVQDALRDVRRGATTKEPALLRRLGVLLDRIVREAPHGAVAALELRDAEFLAPPLLPHLRAMLERSGALHCYALHPATAPLDAQLAAIPPETQPAVVIRWMLRRNHRYDEAVEAYAPFDRLVEPDPEARGGIEALAMHAESLRRPTWIIVNNKAEGSAPLSILELARAMVRARRERRTAPPLPSPAPLR